MLSTLSACVSASLGRFPRRALAAGADPVTILRHARYPDMATLIGVDCLRRHADPGPLVIEKADLNVLMTAAVHYGCVMIMAAHRLGCGYRAAMLLAARSGRLASLWVVRRMSTLPLHAYLEELCCSAAWHGHVRVLENAKHLLAEVPGSPQSIFDTALIARQDACVLWCLRSFPDLDLPEHMQRRYARGRLLPAVAATALGLYLVARGQHPRYVTHGANLTVVANMAIGESRPNIAFSLKNMLSRHGAVREWINAPHPETATDIHVGRQTRSYRYPAVSSGLLGIQRLLFDEHTNIRALAAVAGKEGLLNPGAVRPQICGRGASLTASSVSVCLDALCRAGLPVVSIGSGTGELEAFLEKEFGIHVCCVDPDPHTWANMMKRPVVRHPDYATAADLIAARPELVGACAVLYNWCYPGGNGDYDYESFLALRPARFLSIYESVGAAHCPRFHNLLDSMEPPAPSAQEGDAVPDPAAAGYGCVAYEELELEHMVKCIALVSRRDSALVSRRESECSLIPGFIYRPFDRTAMGIRNFEYRCSPL